MGNREEDDIFKFVAYWLAFIQLYNFDNYGDEEVSETTRIIDYCDKHIDELSDAINFENGYMKVFKERPIISGTSTVGIIHWQQDEETIARFVKERLNCNSYYKIMNGDAENEKMCYCVLKIELSSSIRYFLNDFIIPLILLLKMVNGFYESYAPDLK